MPAAPTDDYFEKARAWAATGIFVAALLLIVGSFLDWIVVEELPPTIPPDQADNAPPFTGLEVRDGWYVLVAGVALLACAVAVILRGRGARVAFLAAIVAGAITISDYRSIPGLFVELEGIGAGAAPGVGITLATAGAILGLIASVAAIAASPRPAT
ncbi:MAG: hypothetical protein M3161_07585 [Actinomycetota bacterium]|nr:hypothetical protein [Actinomycetota bacterium]